MDKLAFVIAPILLVSSLYLFYRDQKQFEFFKTLSKTEDRQQMLKKWVLESFVIYGIGALICLFFLGDISTLLKMPDFLVRISDQLHSSVINGSENKFINSFIKGITVSIVPMLLLGSPLATMLAVYLRHRSTRKKQTEEISDNRGINSLVPRNSQERVWTALLSLNAGFSEELFFRLLAPILIYIISGSVLSAILLSTIWFGLAHYYQGIVGVIATSFVGFLFFGIYLYTQSIWLVILIHSLIDLNIFALTPWFADWLKKRDVA